MLPTAHLLTAQQLHDRLDQPNLCLLDCRFALEDTEYGQRSYAAGHIAGAHFADLERHLSGPIQPGRTGRHPLPAPDTLLAHMRRWGLNEDSEVVLYDDGPGAFAAHAWWLLAWLGKRTQVSLLDGGLKAWRDAGLSLTQAPPPARHGQFAGTPDPALIIDAPRLQAQLGDPGLPLWDARARPRFRGEQEPIDPVAGHIPGACCVPFTDNLDAQGRFLPATSLRQRFLDLLGERSASDVVAYCGSGVTACHNLFALRLAGLPMARLYPGSWSEWITDPDRAIATGD